VITCFKHKISYETGECPNCIKAKQGVTLNVVILHPVHKSNYIQDSIDKVKEQTDKLDALNEKLKRLLIKPKDKND